MFIIFFLALQNLYANGPEITCIELGFDFRGEYNRSFLYELDFAAQGSIELNDLYTFRGGVSLGATGGSFGIKAFTRAEAGPVFKLLHFSLAYIYNGLPAYGAHTHTLLPLVSVQGRWAGISAGPSFRFTRYFGGKPLFETVLSLWGYVNFVSNDNLVIGMSLANYNDFYIGNMGSYSLGVNSFIRINDHWSINNDIVLLQSGSIGLTASFYGIAYRGGFRYTW
jgi:hypothetical protein